MKSIFVVSNVFGSQNQSSHKSGGRPKKTFEQYCDRAKRYKLEELQNTYSQELIDASAVSKMDSTDIAFNVDSALALITQAKLSKYQYEIL